MRHTAPPAGLHRTETPWAAAWSSLLGTVVLIIGLVVPSGTAANAAGPSNVVGVACAPGTGVTAVVDFAATDTDTGAQVEIGCATGPQVSIRAAFAEAGFDLGTAAFTCEINDVLPAPSDCTTYRGSYWSLFTSTDTGTFPGAPVTTWNYGSTGVDNDAPVPVGSAVLFQIQPDAPDRTPRIALSELAELAAAPSSSSSPASSNSGSSEPAESSGSPVVPSTTSPSSGSSSVGTTTPSSESSIVTTPTTAAPDPTLPPVIPATDARALSAAHWLGEQLATAPNGVFGNADFPDWGLTIDALLALSAAGVGGDLIATTAAKIRNSGEDYVGAADDTTGNFARIAKTALALQVAGLDPTSFPTAGGPRNLIAELRGTLAHDGSFGGSDFPFVHAIAMYVLARTPAGIPSQAISWLQSTQCATAGNENFGAYGYDGIDPCSSVDGDGTALAIQALAAAGVPATDPSIEDAAGYLLSMQGANGGVPSSFGGINTNNTGLAAQALDRVQLAPAATARMTSFVSTLQVQCSTLGTTGKHFSETDLGAIAYQNDGGFDSPIVTPDFDNRDQWIRATTQAIFAYHLPSFDRITAIGARSALPPAPTCVTPPTTSNPAPSTIPTSATPTSATTPSATRTSATPTSTTPTSTTALTTPTTSPATSAPGTDNGAPVPGSISLSTDTVAAGGSVTVAITGSSVKARHRVELHSTPVLLGTLTTDDDGNGSLMVRIPADTAVGRHEMVLTAGGVVASVGLTVTAADGSSTTVSTSATLTGPVTTPVDDVGAPLPNTGVSDGLRTLLVTGGLSLLLGAMILLLSRRRTRSGSGTHLS